MKRIHALFTSLLLCASCADPGTDPGQDDNTSRSDDPTAAGAFATLDSDVGLLQGFNKLLDQSSPACVTAGGAGPAYRVGSVEDRFDLTLVSTREDLARQLDVDLGLQVKYRVVDGQSSFNLVDTFKQSRTSVYLLLRAVQSYRVTNPRAVQLTDATAAVLSSDPQGFLNQCGNLFVNGVTYQAELYALIHYDASDEQTANAIKADLGVSTAVPVISVSANAKAALDRNSQRAGVTASASVASRGFLVSGSSASATVVGALLGNGVSIDTFAKIDGLRSAMADSIGKDMCRDAGGSDCNGPGYEMNTIRYARPAVLTLASYQKASNAPRPAAGWNGYADIAATLSRADRYLRNFSKLQNQIAAVYSDEIDAFLSAAPARQLGFGLAPPADPVYSLSGLTGIAGMWRDQFRPEDSTGEGSTSGVIEQLLESCWSAASTGSYDSCVPSQGTNAADAPEYQQAAAQLAAYVQTGRVLPLRFRALDQLTDYQTARTRCSQLPGADGVAMRMPGFDEAQRMGVQVALGSLPRSGTGGLGYVIWHATQSLCGGPAGFNNPPDANDSTEHSVCLSTSEGILLPALCIPTTGPF